MLPGSRPVDVPFGSWLELPLREVQPQRTGVIATKELPGELPGVSLPGCGFRSHQATRQCLARDQVATQRHQHLPKVRFNKVKAAERRRASDQTPDRCPPWPSAARALFFKAPHIGNTRWSRASAKLRPPRRAISDIQNSRLNTPSDSGIPAILPVGFHVMVRDPR